MHVVFLRFRHYVTCILHTCLVINSRNILSRRARMVVGIRNLNIVPAAAPTLCSVRQVNLYVTNLLIRNLLGFV